MNSILAHDIIHDQGQRHAFHIVGKSLEKAIVHVNLPIDEVQDCPDRNIYTTRTYLSPFWKSTTEVGTKNPWQQAVAPIPVTSKCGWLEFANSMALYVLQILGYGCVSWGPWRIKKTDRYIIGFLSTSKCVHTSLDWPWKPFLLKVEGPVFQIWTSYALQRSFHPWLMCGSVDCWYISQ